MNAKVAGYYMIACASTDSSALDMYAYLYYNDFQPNYPTKNLVPIRFDYPDFGKILITVVLQRLVDYTFIFTTDIQNQKGPFLLSAIGPGSVSLSSMNISSKK